MNFNLLVEKWIPIVRKSGKHDWIAPWQIAETDDPPLRVKSPRPDFDSAITQFLIGLLQTAFMPESEEEWRQTLKATDLSSRLKEAFEEHEPCFNLFGDGPRFMQDRHVPVDLMKKVWPVDALLLESPGEKTKNENTDLFVKRAQVHGLEPSTVAAALYNLQCNAPSGGSGHRQSIRGAGPLITVLECASSQASLWLNVWLNVLPENIWHEVPGEREPQSIEDLYPWMGPPRSSDKGEATTRTDITRFEHYWSMSRRIWLHTSASTTHCSLSLRPTSTWTEQYHARPQGTNYKGVFQHPLTPYTLDKKSPQLKPFKLGSEGILYRDWPGITMGASLQLPALAVSYGAKERSRLGFPLRIWASGFSMDKMKAEAFFSARQPLLSISEQYAARLSNLSSALIQSADSARRIMLDALKIAFKRSTRSRKDLKVNQGALATASRAFWVETHHDFFSQVSKANQLYSQLPSSVLEGEENDSDLLPEEVALKESWLKTLHKAAVSGYRQYSQESAGMLGTDPKQLAEGFRRVNQLTHPGNRKFRHAIGLAPLNRRKAS